MAKVVPGSQNGSPKMTKKHKKRHLFFDFFCLRPWRQKKYGLGSETKKIQKLQTDTRTDTRNDRVFVGNPLAQALTADVGASVCQSFVGASEVRRPANGFPSSIFPSFVFRLSGFWISWGVSKVFQIKNRYFLCLGALST